MEAPDGQPAFAWDEANIRHLARHRVSPVEAEQAILDERAILMEMQEVDGEERIQALGATKAGRLLVVIFTFRGEAIRPVTAYNAPRALLKTYLEGGQQ